LKRNHAFYLTKWFTNQIVEKYTFYGTNTCQQKTFPTAEGGLSLETETDKVCSVDRHREDMYSISQRNDLNPLYDLNTYVF
jgi:hypothetical protein